ncbi:hypothetical protein A1O7_07379 [Cladophialophora yegresii CBS 114405]|uniref:Uncharacterized protein n=1 Tax=Cladophialophora yegresii CBS 114405 TaxID=1182544 RepID=W9VWG7_9EURO|nr:uncharacterized protein A1O7_07379 [Cladophialophora yegresii CBS 114405]EXJ57035.1 hypothetical protein A1O7_07379 [Cladophialophora yegresii CBS 114405]
MEIIGTAASIATLVEVLKVAVELQQRLQDAPSEIDRTLRHVQFVALQLRTLMEVERSIERVDELERSCAAMLRQCHHGISAVRASLASTVGQKHGKRLRWALLGRARSKEFMIELACLDSSLSVVLNILQCRRLDVLCDTVSKFKQDMSMSTFPARTARPSHYCIHCRQKYPDLAAKTIKSVPHRKSTGLRQWKCFYPELVRLTMQAAYSCDSSRNTSSLLLRLDVMSLFGLQFEFSGWIPSFRIDRIMLDFKYVVPEDDPFMVACGAGDVNLVQELLLKYPGISHYRDTWEQSPLGVAIAAGHGHICRLLIDNGAKVDSTFGMYHTSTLSCALRHRNLQIARLLIAEGAQFDHTNAWGWSAFFYLWSDTVQQEQASDLIDLLRSQSEVDWQSLHRGIVDDAGWTVLARCAVFGTPEDMLTLIRYGVDPTEGPPASGWTALHVVVQHGAEDAFFSLLPWFLDHGDVDLPDFTGWTLLHLAVENGNPNIIRQLLQNGADWRARTLPSCDKDIPESVRGISASTLQIAASCGDQRYLDFLDVLDDLGFLDDGAGDGVGDGDVWFDAVVDQS